MDELFDSSGNILGSYLIMVNGLPNLDGMGLMTGLWDPLRVVCSTVVMREEEPWLRKCVVRSQEENRPVKKKKSN